MTDETKRTLFTGSFVAAAIFYAWATFSLWLGPVWKISWVKYGLIGVLPAFLGVLCTIAALALHLELRDHDSSGPKKG
ncbi:MAG: hypothetical protein ABEL51_11570 [Salinibacter sp.]